MIASCAFDIKFHDWESCSCLGSFLPSDHKKNGFVDITWCNEGHNLVAVPYIGKSCVLKPQQQPHNSFNKKETTTTTNITKEPIDIPSVKCASFSHVENQYVALGTTTGHVMLYSVTHKKALQLFEELPASINYIQYGAGDSYLVAGCSNGQIFLFEAGHGVTATYCVPSSNTLTAMRAHPVYPQFLGGASDRGTVAVWDTQTADCVFQAANHKGVVVDMAFSMNDETFMTVGMDRTINIYDLRTDECVHQKVFDQHLTTLAYCPNGNDVVVGNSRGHIICLDKRYLNISRSGMIAHNTAVKKIRFQFPCLINKEKIADDDDAIMTMGANNTNKENVRERPGGGDTTKPILDSLPFPQIQAVFRGAPKADFPDTVCDEFTIFHIIDDRTLTQFREEIMKMTQEMVKTILESVSAEFLKLRMEITRQFCGAESMSKANLFYAQQYIAKLASALEDDHNLLDKKSTLMSQFDAHFKSLEQSLEIDLADVCCMHEQPHQFERSLKLEEHLINHRDNIGGSLSQTHSIQKSSSCKR